MSLFILYPLLPPLHHQFPVTVWLGLLNKNIRALWFTQDHYFQETSCVLESTTLPLCFVRHIHLITSPVLITELPASESEQNKKMC